MTTHDLQIKNARILRNGELVGCDVFVSSGKISSIGVVQTDRASRSIDAAGRILLPGLIDPHVHFRDPGATYKEDFLTGSRGAVVGGTTTVFDMPNTKPSVTSTETLLEKARSVKTKAVCNFGLIAGASHENISSMMDLAKSGAIAFKTFMISPPVDREKDYAGMSVTDSGQLLQTMEGVARTGLVHCIHAECDSTVSMLTEKMKLENRKDPRAHYDSRPNFTEEEAVSDAIILASQVRSKLHIVHVSTKQAIDLISGAKKKGVNVSCETCPQYLLFTNEILDKRGPYGKFNPPPRTVEDRDSLVNSLASREIDMVATDHAPHTNSEKQLGFGDIFMAPSGTPGVETRLPILLTFVHQGKLLLNDIPRISSSAVAKRFGIYPRKGTIEIGSDADLAIVDIDQAWKIRSSELQTKSWETDLYDGMEVKGRVKFTIVNGEIAYEDGSGFASPGHAEFIRPQ